MVTWCEQGVHLAGGRVQPALLMSSSRSPGSVRISLQPQIFIHKIRRPDRMKCGDHFKSKVQ